MCVCVYVQTDPQGNPVSMTVPHVQLINPENQIVEVSRRLCQSSGHGVASQTADRSLPFISDEIPKSQTWSTSN